MTREEFDRRSRAKMDYEHYQSIQPFLMKDPKDGVIFRGRVNLVKCRVCGCNRWDDGTSCKGQGGTCRAYQDIEIQAQAVRGVREGD